MYKRGENVKATLKVQGQLHNLKAGIYIVGKKSTEFEHDIIINDASIDVKHAAIEIHSAKWKVIDMCSKSGTFVQNERLQPLQAKDISDQTTIKFGAISCDFNAKEDDDDDLFGDSPSSDIIPGSPELSIKSQPVNSGTSRIRNRSRKSITLTPQKIDKQMEKDITSQKETIKIKSPEKKETKQNDESFLIPSTQSRQNRSNLNSTKEFRTSVCAFEEDEDDFFIPETQDVAHSETRSNKSDETIRFVTEDFNAGEDDLCLQSQNVLGDAASFLHDDSEIIPYIKPDGDLSKNKPISDMNIAEEEKEMSALQWNETNILNVKPIEDLKSTSVTPDLDFEDDELMPVKENDPVQLVAETEDLPETQVFIPQPQKPSKDSSKTTENVYTISPTNKENVLSIPNVNAKMNVDGGFAVPFSVRKSVSKHESSFKEPEKMKIKSPVENKVSNDQSIREDEDDDLPSTQIFNASFLKTSKEPPKPENEDDDLLATQVFNASLYLSKKIVKVDINSEDLLDQTQPFVMSPKSIKNKNEEDVFVRPPTQEFQSRKHIRPRTPVLLESDEEELSDPELHMAATLPIGEEPRKETNEKKLGKSGRNKLFSSDDEDDSNDKSKMGPPKASTSSSSTRSANSPKAVEKKKSKMSILFGSDDEDSREKENDDKSLKSSSSTRTTISSKSNDNKFKRTSETTPRKKGTSSNSTGSDTNCAKATKNRRKSTILMDIPDTPDFINLKLPSKDKLKMAGELFSREAVTAKLTFPFEQSSDEEDSCDKTIPFEADKSSVEMEHSIKSEKSESKNTKEKSEKTETVKKEEDSDSSATTSTKTFKIIYGTRPKSTKKLENDEKGNASDSTTSTTSTRTFRMTSGMRSKSTIKLEKVEENNDSDSSVTTSTKTIKFEPSVSSKSAKDSSEQEVRKSSRRITKPKFADEEEHKTSSPPPPSRTSKRRLHNVPDEDAMLKNIKSLQKEDKRKQESSAASTKSNRKRIEAKPSEPEVPEKRTRLRKRNPSTEKASSSSSGKQTPYDSESSPLRKATRPIKERVVFTKIESSPFEKKLKRMGAELVESPKDCTVLITDRVYRTWKFLSAVVRGIPIVPPEWLNSSGSNPDEYILADHESETRFKFNLKKSIEMARKKPIFENYMFYITPNTKPTPFELTQIIKSGHGTVTDKLSPYYKNEDKFYIVSDRSDKSLWAKLKQIVPNAKIIKTEGIMTAALQQCIQFKYHHII